MITCPCCKQPYDYTGGLKVDLCTNTAITAEKTVRLRGRLAEMLSILLDGHGEYVSRERIFARMYGIGDSPDSTNLLSVYKCNLGKVLAPLGYQIDTSYGYGYRVCKSEANVKNKEDAV